MVANHIELTEQIIRIPKSIFHNWSIAIKQSSRQLKQQHQQPNIFNTLNGNGVIVWPHHDYKQIDNVKAVIDSDSNSNKMVWCAGFRVYPVEFQFFRHSHSFYFSAAHDRYENNEALDSKVNLKTVNVKGQSFIWLFRSEKFHVITWVAPIVEQALCQYENICFVQWPFANAKIM